MAPRSARTALAGNNQAVEKEHRPKVRQGADPRTALERSYDHTPGHRPRERQRTASFGRTPLRMRIFFNLDIDDDVLEIARLFPWFPCGTGAGPP